MGDRRRAADRGCAPRSGHVPRPRQRSRRRGARAERSEAPRAGQPGDHRERRHPAGGEGRYRRRDRIADARRVRRSRVARGPVQSRDRVRESRPARRGRVHCARAPRASAADCAAACRSRAAAARCSVVLPSDFLDYNSRHSGDCAMLRTTAPRTSAAKSPKKGGFSQVNESISSGVAIADSVSISTAFDFKRRLDSTICWRAWMRRHVFGAALAVLLGGISAHAQQTTGNITGRILDPQGAAVPGVTVTARSAATGFTRTEVSDAEGIYRLNALPVGIYDVTAELQGFASVSRKAIDVNVGQTQTVDFALRVAAVAETVNVTGASPLIEITASWVGAIVDPKRIETLPLNGRQFANLAATVPGVGLGFHTDPTKSTQYSPQINGGNGRNVNYQIDGGDNNDDTVGGLLQMFPLEAIQEFNFQTQRFKAEYGRSNGGVLNVVTKSGTNTPSGSFFEMFRDTKMNAKTETEKITNVDKQQYRRNQYGGSFGGPITRDKAHFFAAVERTQQNTFQSVSTDGLFPSPDGIYPTPYTESLVTVKETTNISTAQFLSVRYGYNQNSQPYGVSPTTPQSGWGLSTNKFHSFNLNDNYVLSGARLNEFIFQYADFANAITANSLDPYQVFPNTVSIGQNINTPQATQQKKYLFRDDFSW